MLSSFANKYKIINCLSLKKSLNFLNWKLLMKTKKSLLSFCFFAFDFYYDLFPFVPFCNYLLCRFC